MEKLFDADKKRDELFLAFQREQAEANRRHEQLILNMLLQNGCAQQQQYARQSILDAKQ